MTSLAYYDFLNSILTTLIFLFHFYKRYSVLNDFFMQISYLVSVVIYKTLRELGVKEM